MNPNPSLYDQHKEKSLGFAEAVEHAATHWSIVSFTLSLQILRAEGLPRLTISDFL